MANKAKKAIAKARVEGVITDLMVRTNTDNVMLNDDGVEKPLSSKLSEIILALNGKATPADITTALGSYVKTEEGKGLSANDLTDELLAKLNGIAVGAQVNKIESVKVNGAALSIGEDKSVDIAVPTKVSQLDNDSSYQTETQVETAISKAVAAADHLKRKVVNSTAEIDLSAPDASQYIYMVPKGNAGDADKYDEYMVIDGVLEKMGDWGVDLSGYVQKEDGKGLSTNDYTTAEKEKLAGVAAGAQVNVLEGVKVNGAALSIGADKSVDVSVPVIYAQADQPAGLKAGDLWFQIID